MNDHTAYYMRTVEAAQARAELRAADNEDAEPAPKPRNAFGADVKWTREFEAEIDRGRFDEPGGDDDE